MNSVFIVQHEYERFGVDEAKLVGVYKNRPDAELAVGRLVAQPGFRDWPDGFTIGEYEIGQDHWTEGFAVMVNIMVPTIDGQSAHCATSTWRPGDQYEIENFGDAVDLSSVRFSVGDVVECADLKAPDGFTYLTAVRRASNQAKQG